MSCYYDTETEYYYLQSRYYDPITGRFLNADAFVSTGQGFTGNNMFVYCGNNPVTRKDSNGYLWHIVVGAAVGGAIAGALVSAASYLVTSGITGDNVSLKGVLSAIGTGAVSGAIGGAAGALGGIYAVAGSITVGLFNGTVTALNTEGSVQTKLLAGGTTALITGFGTYIGTNIYTPTDEVFNAAVSAYAGGLTVGAPTEIINVTSNAGIIKATQPLNIKSSDYKRHLRAERVFG